MKVLVCGGRGFSDYELLERTLDRLGVTHVIHGGARGADTMAGQWATKRGVSKTVILPDWGKHGAAAGPIRNGQMLQCGPEMVVAFPGGVGTRNAVEQARRKGVKVLQL